MSTRFRETRCPGSRLLSRFRPVSSWARVKLFKRLCTVKGIATFCIPNCTAGYESGGKVRHVLIAPSYSGFQGHDLSWESVGRKSSVSSMGGLMLFSLSWALAPPCMVFLLQVGARMPFQASHSSRGCCRTRCAVTWRRKRLAAARLPCFCTPG